jgi:hypothetical protein
MIKSNVVVLFAWIAAFQEPVPFSIVFRDVEAIWGRCPRGRISIEQSAGFVRGPIVS